MKIANENKIESNVHSSNSDHQADSNLCSFWKYCSNKEWYIKKYHKLWEIRNKSICSSVSGKQA